MDLFNFLYEQTIAQDARNAQNKASHVESQLQDLQRQHAQLQQFTRALWSLLKERNGLTDDDLKAHLLAVRESAKKQAATPRFQHCEACNHQVAISLATCPYCGRELRAAEVF